MGSKGIEGDHQGEVFACMEVYEIWIALESFRKRSNMEINRVPEPS